MAAIDIWFGGLDVPLAQARDMALLLSLPERARAERFRHARDRRRFIVRRARLRQCLAIETGIAPERLTFVADPGGKPRLVEPGPCFSLSHSGEYWLLATSTQPVGADIECHDAAIDHRDIARGLFGPGEQSALAALPDAPARRAFFECWARKEAFVKAIGQGLAYPLDAFEVSVDADARLISGGEGWAMRRLDLGASIAGAVVARDDRQPLSIRLRTLDPARIAA